MISEKKSHSCRRNLTKEFSFLKAECPDCGVLNSHAWVANGTGALGTYTIWMCWSCGAKSVECTAHPPPCAGKLWPLDSYEATTITKKYGIS